MKVAEKWSHPYVDLKFFIDVIRNFCPLIVMMLNSGIKKKRSYFQYGPIERAIYKNLREDSTEKNLLVREEN